jgi:hypothetical protein
MITGVSHQDLATTFNFYYLKKKKKATTTKKGICRQESGPECGDTWLGG